MKSAEFSEHTKNVLADALTELTRTFPFRKITASFVAHKANVHRNTLYYHFSGIEDLILWTLHRDLSRIQTQKRVFLITYLSRNDKLLRFALSVLGFDAFTTAMRQELKPIVAEYCEGAANKASEDILINNAISQILTAFLTEPRPAKMINMLFDYVIPELKKHDLA